jgi:hypothetical protein
VPYCAFEVTLVDSRSDVSDDLDALRDIAYSDSPTASREKLSLDSQVGPSHGLEHLLLVVDRAAVIGDHGGRIVG